MFHRNGTNSKNSNEAVCDLKKATRAATETQTLLFKLCQMNEIENN